MDINKIGKYTISFPIKQGSYAYTYKVKDDQGKNFFLKLINIAKLSLQQIDSATHEVTEVALAMTVQHRNLLHTVDTGEIVIDGQKYAYLVCDYIVGESLKDKLQRDKHCTVYEIKQIVTGILDGLEYLHQREPPIIHNAILPQNIMLDMTGTLLRPVIVDFGHTQTLATRNTQFFCEDLNPFYLAPEMFHQIFSIRTDLYAVGVLMYNMLYGFLPWYINICSIPKEDLVAAILQARQQPLKVPNVNIFELNDNMLHIIAKATEQNVDKRFQSAKEFLQAIQQESTTIDSTYHIVDIPQRRQEHNTLSIKKGNGFADVAGMEQLKERLQTEVIDLFQHPEKYKKLRVNIPNGILLYGPPGCGKTFIAEKLAEELQCNYMYVRCSDIATPYIHGGQEKIAALFNKARKDAPTILFLDELDSLIADRSRHNTVSEAGEVTEFLTQINNCADDRVLVIGATNNPRGIDHAALRSGRFDIKVFVPAPDDTARGKLLQLFLKDIAHTDVDYNKLTFLTKGYMANDIKLLVNKAALITARHDKDHISMDTLLVVINNSKGELPSVTSSMIKEYESIRDEFEGNYYHNTIGFH